MSRSALLVAAFAAACAARSFNVTNNQFVKDGQPFIIKSGSIHYHRTHPAYWQDRIQRMKAMGLNAIQTYVPWNTHEIARGVYDFSGARNLTAFLDIANANDMLVLLRPGPFVCGEHDFGGFPAYLLTEPGIVFRTNNSAYLARVEAWWNVLLPTIIRPQLYANGGPITSVQVENEFGSYGDVSSNPGDAAYIRYLRALAGQLLGDDPVLFYTTDGGDTGFLSRGALPGEIYATGDFGPTNDPASNFAAQDQFNPPGWRAHIDSEYYPGWLTHWSEQMANTSSLGSAAGLSAILALNGSFNIYMAFGGTNWGFHNGANAGGDGSGFSPVITSYDYDAPISEGGEHGYGGDGDKFAAIRQVLAYWQPAGSVIPPEPPLPPRTAYAPVTLSTSSALFDWATLMSITPEPVFKTSTIGHMESYGVGTVIVPGTSNTAPVNQSEGYIIYRTNVTASLAAAVAAAGAATSTIAIANPGDRAIVFINGAAVGTLFRNGAKSISVDSSLLVAGATVDFLVENMGHINYGHGIFDPKGFASSASVTVNGNTFNGAWDVFPTRIDTILQGPGASADAAWATSKVAAAPSAPVFLSGTLTVAAGQVADTWITVCGFGKGVIAINGFNIGRYWESEGPQHAFYVPAALLTEGDNTIVVFELENVPSNATIGFTAGPDFTGAVCGLTHENAAAAEPRELKMTAPTKHEQLATVASAATCASKPFIGLNVTLQPCSSPAINLGLAFQFTNPQSLGGLITIAADPTLCLVVNGTNPSTNTPNVAVGACNVNDLSQQWLWFRDVTGGIMSITRGMFFDLPNSSTTPGTRIELYSSNGGNNNQRFIYDQANNRIISVSDQTMCIAAC